MTTLSPSEQILHPISNRQTLPPVETISDETLRKTALAWLRKNDLNALYPGPNKLCSPLTIRIASGRFVQVHFAPQSPPVEKQWPFKVTGHAGSHFSEGIITGGRVSRLYAVIQEWEEATKAEPKLRQALTDKNSELGQGFDNVVRQVSEEVERFICIVGATSENWEKNDIESLLLSVAGYSDDPEILPEMLHDYIESSLVENGVPHSPSVVRFALVHALKRKGYQIGFTPEPKRGLLVTSFCLDNDVFSQIEVGVSLSEEHNFNRFPFIARKHRDWWRKSKHFESPQSLSGENKDEEWDAIISRWQNTEASAPAEADKRLVSDVELKLPDETPSRRRDRVGRLMKIRGNNPEKIQRVKDAFPRKRSPKRKL